MFNGLSKRRGGFFLAAEFHRKYPPGIGVRSEPARCTMMYDNGLFMIFKLFIKRNYFL